MAEEVCSIALTTFNGERFLTDQLDSFAGQTRLPDELVVCDDGSTDGTLDILRDFADRAPFDVHLHRNIPTLGLSRNFEKAVSSCRGDLIFLSDQDDVWDTTKVEKVRAAFDPESMVVISDQMICDDHLEDQGVSILQNIRSLGLPEDYFVAGCSTAMRAQWRDLALPLPSDHIAYDTWINRLASILRVRTVLREPLQRYRRHGANNSTDVTSSVSALSPRDLTASYGGREQVLDGWSAEIRDSRDFVHRLAASADFLARHGLERRAELAVDDLEARSAALAERCRVLRRSGVRRATDVARLWARGGYADFQGIKSALKDIARAG